MSKLLAALSGQGAGAVGTVAAASVAVSVAVGAGVFVYQRNAAPEAATPQPAAQVAAPDAQAEQGAEPGAETAATPAPPSISTFRLDPDGRLLVAGRGEPGWDHSILVDDEALVSFLPEANGEFVQFLSLDASPEPRVLALTMQGPGGQLIRSEDEIIIAPQTVVASAETQPEVSSQTVLVSDEEGVRVVQPPVPGETPPEVMSSVALDAISYSKTGEVQLSGRASGAGEVRLYLDNAPVGTSRVAPDGAWRADLPEVETRVYTLRVDEVDGEGKVTSRVETPFQREEPEVVARQDMSGAGVQALTVQPGNTLWAISRERYGEGTLYMRIFEANKDRIRDPDLIYPGQVFDLPVTE